MADYKEAIKNLQTVHGMPLTIRLAIEALEKQIPSKPKEMLGFCCPYCNEEVELIPWDKDETTYCLHCGQSLDWSESIDNEDE